MDIRLLSGGAANGLVDKMRDPFRDRTGRGVAGDFGAVGGMKDRIMAGEPVDIAILTRSAIDALVAAGRLDAASITDLGEVATGVAVKQGAVRPEIATPEALAAAFAAADGVFCPDTVKATAGIHVATVLDRLGIRDAVRLREYPNGQTAMAQMAQDTAAHPLGCTQVTEIMNTPGVDLVGLLPDPFGLSTTYTAAIATDAAAPDDARTLIALLADPGAAALRRSVGFT